MGFAPTTRTLTACCSAGLSYFPLDPAIMFVTKIWERNTGYLAVPTSVDLVLPARQAGVQGRYTMTPNLNFEMHKAIQRV